MPKTMIFPDPWDPATGRLIDEWLQILRACGLSDANLESVACMLGQISNKRWNAETHKESIIIQGFLRWSQTQLPRVK